MTRLLNVVSLIAVGAVLALTSVAQAQQLGDGVQTIPFAGNVINLPADANPVGDVGDATGGTETQINFETGHNISYGAFPGTRTYSSTEVNILDVNLNAIPASGGNVMAIYNNSEVNLLVPVVPFPDSDSGFIGNEATFDANSTLNMTGGLVGVGSTINGVANVSGGNVGSNTFNRTTISGTLNLTEVGRLGANSTVLSGGTVNLTSADPNPDLTSIGGGQMFEPGSTLNVDSGMMGTNSIFAGVVNATGGRFTNGTTVSGTFNISGNATVSSASFIRTGGTINASDDTILFGLTIDSGGTLNLSDNADFRNATIEGVVNMNGGSALFTYTVQNGGVFNIMDGALGTGPLNIGDGGTVNHSGGNLGFNTDVESGGVLNISGGSFGASINFADLDVDSGGTVNFIGTDFSIAGNPIPGLTLGTTVTITDRRVLTGTLLDGSPVNFNLSAGGNDVFAAGATVTVTLSEPVPDVVHGDVTGDGFVNFLDIAPFITVLAAGGTPAEEAAADCNMDGMVSFLDIAPFINALANAGS